MSIDTELLLPPDVEIFSVRTLAPDVRATIDAADEDFALTRGRSRAPSRIVDKDSADLLGAFRTPSRIVEAVLSYAGKRGLDPELTLEQAYPLLYRLYEAKILVPAQGPDAGAIDGALEVGASVGDFHLLRCIQVLDDNEVFLARSAAGRYAAVKYYRRPDDRVVRELENEAAMLRRAGRARAPELYSLARHDSGLALVTEWVFGSAVTNAAAVHRGRNQARSEQHLLALCVEVAAAFADLHEAGVLHGDVHPKNVLVEARGTARLIDFGLARAVDEATLSSARGGVAFYFDPEFAQSLRGKAHAGLTAAGEQYSVASLLYQLWTGVFYLDWSLERDELLRQVAEESPVPFEKRSVPAWPELEAILLRALHKRTEERYPDMRSFAAALRQLLPQAEARDRSGQRRRTGRARDAELLERSLRRYALDGEALREGLAGPPLASINYGASGIAYAMYRMAQRRADPSLLALADVWTQRAYGYANDYDKSFYNPALQIEPKTVGRVALYHSPSGLHCVRALVSAAQGNAPEAARAVHAFVAHSRGECQVLDLTLGRASLLIGCADLVEALPKSLPLDLGPLLGRGAEIAGELMDFLGSDDIATSTRMNTLGIAHGWAGLLFALLRWARATEAQVDPLAVTKLNDLAGLCEPHAGGVRWSVQNSTAASAFMDGWCNGTAGHAMLYALAAEVTRKGSFAELAERAAASAWASELRYGTLCCGLAGIAYAMVATHRLTGSDVWLDRARTLGRRAAADGSRHLLRDALYKGSVGVALLADDLRDPGSARMPLFESVR